MTPEVKHRREKTLWLYYYTAWLWHECLVMPDGIHCIPIWYQIAVAKRWLCQTRGHSTDVGDPKFSLPVDTLSQWNAEDW